MLQPPPLRCHYATYANSCAHHCAHHLAGMTLSHRCSHCSVDPSLASNATSLQYSNASVFMPSHCAHHHASEITLSHPRLHCADDPLMNDAVLECLDFPAGLESVRYARIDAWEGHRQSIPVNAHHTQSGTALTVTATTLTVTASSSHSLALLTRWLFSSPALLTHWLFSLTGSHWLSNDVYKCCVSSGMSPNARNLGGLGQHHVSAKIQISREPDRTKEHVDTHSRISPQSLELAGKDYPPFFLSMELGDSHPPSSFSQILSDRVL